MGLGFRETNWARLRFSSSRDLEEERNPRRRARVWGKPERDRERKPEK